MSLPTTRVDAPEPPIAPEQTTGPLPPGGAPSSEFLRFFGAVHPASPALSELVAIAQRLAPRNSQSRPAPIPAPAGEALPQRNPLGPAISPETIVARVGTLASMPNIYFQVDRAINHPASSTARIGACGGVCRTRSLHCAQLPGTWLGEPPVVSFPNESCSSDHNVAVLSCAEQLFRARETSAPVPGRCLCARPLWSAWPVAP
jgi:hypothetical protein